MMSSSSSSPAAASVAAKNSKMFSGHRGLWFNLALLLPTAVFMGIVAMLDSMNAYTFPLYSWLVLSSAFFVVVSFNLFHWVGQQTRIGYARSIEEYMLARSRIKPTYNKVESPLIVQSPTPIFALQFERNRVMGKMYRMWNTIMMLMLLVIQIQIMFIYTYTKDQQGMQDTIDSGFERSQSVAYIYMQKLLMLDWVMRMSVVSVAFAASTLYSHYSYSTLDKTLFIRHLDQ